MTKLTASQRSAFEALASAKEDVAWRATIAATEYTDPARFELERRRVFERVPMLVGLSAQLPQPNSYMRGELLGLPLLLTRDAGGRVRAFVNVCRHRGTLLCPETETVGGARIVCPYHAWTYALDGRLLAVPRPDAFPGLDKKDHALQALPAREAGGLIWVGLQPGRDEMDFSSVEGALSEELDALELGAMSIYRRTTYPLAANWKLVMDTMLDKYHVLRLHRNTLAKFFDDAAEVSDLIGPHVRAVSGRSAFRLDAIGEDFESTRSTSVLGYTLFPNGMIVTSPLYVSFMVIRPIDVGHCAVDYFMLVTPAVAAGGYEDKLRKSFELMDVAFGKEDFWAAELGQRGLSAGTLPALELGGLERRIKLFHDALDATLGVGDGPSE